MHTKRALYAHQKNQIKVPCDTQKRPISDRTWKWYAHQKNPIKVPCDTQKRPNSDIQNHKEEVWEALMLWCGSHDDTLEQSQIEMLGHALDVWYAH